MFARFCIYFNHHKEEPSMDIQTLLYELKKYEDSMLTNMQKPAGRNTAPLLF